ncbi:seven-hairpin glycosidase [Mucor ambiguus]|uniref:alpha-1,2-Mannosidase n=1 Tax=Mucor ambiguus TaxID=91626 RepID=A0A0C9MCW9_9FUNG|nr:seven-hairpin glycosidase [Mucor ambiguus]
MRLITLSFCLLTTLLSTSSVNASPANSNEFRAKQIRSAFKHAWQGYSTFAYGHDELLPVSGSFSDSRNGWGASIFDALDTMIIMGLDEEYQESLQFVANVNWTSTQTPSKTFETCIRYLGGLLSAYDLRPDPMLLTKALELVDQVLLPAFATKNQVPAAFVNVPRKRPMSSKTIILAEFALQLEFVRLSQVTNDPKWERLGNQVIEKIARAQTPLAGLYSISWNADTFQPSKSSYITVSGGGDSFYEYLLKTHILMGGNEELQLQMWKQSVDSMYHYLRSVSADGSVFLGEALGDNKYLKSGELVCFMPGNLLLGARFLQEPAYEIFAQELMDSCFKTWHNSPTGLSPESWSWMDQSSMLDDSVNAPYTADQKYLYQDLAFIPTGNSYLLRPETLESLFYFYRLTGDAKYQDMAWEIFESIERHCKTEYGYSSVEDIMDNQGDITSDFQESFFFAETLKYLFLIFSDKSLISLDDYVFNTEAHPFRLSTSIKVQA